MKKIKVSHSENILHILFFKNSGYKCWQPFISATARVGLDGWNALGNSPRLTYGKLEFHIIYLQEWTFKMGWGILTNRGNNIAHNVEKQDSKSLDNIVIGAKQYLVKALLCNNFVRLFDFENWQFLVLHQKKLKSEECSQKWVHAIASTYVIFELYYF